MLHFHIGSQITDIRRSRRRPRGRPRLREARGPGRADPVPRRRRRPRRRLRRLQDGLRRLHELLRPGVRQRRRLHDPADLRRGAGAAADPRHRVGPRRRRLPLRLRDERPRRRGPDRAGAARPRTAADPNVVKELASIYETVNAKKLRECYHDAIQYKEELFTLFNLGHLSLEDRAKGEVLFWQICEKIHRDLEDAQGDPGRVRGPGDDARRQVHLNFSVFQSLPDIWAIDQLFPILPIHRLNEKPPSSARSPTSPATPTARSRSSSTCATSRRLCPSTRSATASPTTSASASWARTRTCSATSTTSSARRTRSSSPWTSRAAPKIEDVLPGESCQRVLEYMNYDRTEILDSIDKQLRRAAGRTLKKDEVRAIYREFEEVFPRYTYLER